MAFTIVTNTLSLNAQNNLSRTQQMLSVSMQRLSSGLRINRSGDDAAGLAVSENLKAQVRGLAQAERNANDGVSLLQVAEGGMNEVSGILSRMRELAVQSSSDTIGDTERGYLQQEFDALTTEITRISDVTEFNGTKLLDGTASAIDIQVGINNTSNDRISLAVGSVAAADIGGDLTAEDISSKSGAQSALDALDTAIDDVASTRADVGAMQNRLQITISNLGSARENLSAANSRIRDADIAEETSQMTRNSILMQAGISVLSQANQLPSLALSLLGR